MNNYLDCEFIELGPDHPIQLVSMGLVNEEGQQWYAELAGVDYSKADSWFKKNVVPHLVGGNSLLTRSQMASQLEAFFKDGDDDEAQLWGWVSAYDMVCFAQLWGTMMNMPKGIPNLCRDLKQLALSKGLTKKDLPKQKGKLHDALQDALWNKEVHKFLIDPPLTQKMPKSKFADYIPYISARYTSERYSNPQDQHPGRNTVTVTRPPVTPPSATPANPPMPRINFDLPSGRMFGETDAEYIARMSRPR